MVVLLVAVLPVLPVAALAVPGRRCGCRRSATVALVAAARFPFVVVDTPSALFAVVWPALVVRVVVLPSDPVLLLLQLLLLVPTVAVATVELQLLLLVSTVAVATVDAPVAAAAVPSVAVAPVDAPVAAAAVPIVAVATVDAPVPVAVPTVPISGPIVALATVDAVDPLAFSTVCNP